MAKSILYRLFKIGKMQNQYKKVLKADKDFYLEEGIPYKRILKNYKASGHIAKYKISVGVSSIGYSPKNFVATCLLGELLNLPIHHKSFQNLNFSNYNNKLKIDLDISKFKIDHTGSIELIFKVDDINKYIKFINQG